MKVLYLHPAGSFGGASKSLIEMFAVLRAEGVEGVVLTPRGSAVDLFEKVGLRVVTARGLSQFDNTRYGYYRGFRWLIILREFFFFPFSLLALFRLRHEKFDILHINEVTLLPLGFLAKKLFSIPMVVHVRSLQRRPEEGVRTSLINHWLRKYADAVVAIDHTVATTLDVKQRLEIVHNGLGVDVVDFVREPDQQADIKIGFLGVLIELKGIFELVEAMRILKGRGVSAKLIIAGENARQLSGFKAWVLGKFGFARDVRSEIEAVIRRENLESHVELLGFVSDVRNLYPQLDILCFPSHLDAAGRPVFEAAFYSIPSIVAVSNPLPDAVQHEVTGIAIPIPDPVLIADALQRLIETPELRRKLGAQAKIWAEATFAIEVNAARMLKIYRQVNPSNRHTLCVS